MAERQAHPIAPVFDEMSRILILGSFPSVKSREAGFFYGHPQNRFWRVLAAVLGCPVPATIDEKRNMLLAHHVAVWDVIASCEITGSSDSSIRDVVPTNLRHLLQRRHGAAPLSKISAEFHRHPRSRTPLHQPRQRCMDTQPFDLCMECNTHGIGKIISKKGLTFSRSML